MFLLTRRSFKNFPEYAGIIAGFSIVNKEIYLLSP